MKRINALWMLFVIPITCVCAQVRDAKEVVQEFLVNVRSGKYPDSARCYFADTVLAHQIDSENTILVRRTPGNYTEHIYEFLSLFGKFEFTIAELIANDEKVFVRWKQTGRHIAEINGYAPTGLPLTEITSAVYRVEGNKIVEYWIQTDRFGFNKQLSRNALKK